MKLSPAGQSQSMDLLAQITELSHQFGTADYVKGGGGNTSAKTADTLWVKPSGMTLASLRPASFVAMDRAKLARLYEVNVPANATAREALVKDMMAAAVKPGQTARPSVEAPLHDILTGMFVVHTHATLVNGLTCSRQGREVCARLFPEALWVPYIDPGFTLCMDVRRRVRGHKLVILENHGIFVAGDTADDIRATYRRVLDALRAEYAKAGISTELKAAVPAAAGPITPDHIVYAKSKNAELARQMAADCALIVQLAEAFGGAQYLDERARQFIEHWEVEAYRQQQLG